MHGPKLPLRGSRVYKRAGPSAAAALAGTPNDLRRSDLRVGDEHFVVLSYVAKSQSAIPGLTPTESAVARAAAAGLRSAEIAANRGCSRFTIQNQLASVYRKLGVSSRRS